MNNICWLSEGRQQGALPHVRTPVTTCTPELQDYFIFSAVLQNSLVRHPALGSL